jgi:hypothetical protein
VLLSHTAPQLRKVARVAGTTFLQLKGKYVDIPDVYYLVEVESLRAFSRRVKTRERL